jgi:hypothetical protein
MQGVFLQPIAVLLAIKATLQTARDRVITGRKDLCRGSPARALIHWLLRSSAQPERGFCLKGFRTLLSPKEISNFIGPNQ